MSSSTDIKVKVLVVGDVDGKYKTLHKKLTKINAKYGPFEAALVCAPCPVLDGSIIFPIPVYIVAADDSGADYVPQEMWAAGGELAPNLFFLGSHGVVSLASGLRIAYLSGLHRSPQAFHGLDGAPLRKPDAYPSYYQVPQLDALLMTAARLQASGGFPGVDMLIAPEWPINYAVDAQAPPPGPGSATRVTPALSGVLAALRPRYVVSGGVPGAFFEAPPVANVYAPHATRFVGVAALGNKGKAQALYALNVTPVKALTMAEAAAEGGAARPWPHARYPQLDAVFGPGARPINLAAVAASQEASAPASFFFGGGSEGKRTKPNGGGSGGNPNAIPTAVPSLRIMHIPPPPRAPAPAAPVQKRRVRSRAPRAPSRPCWFCLSSPQVEQHLVASVGTECYLALPKGGLSPGHVLVLPIEHYPSGAGLPATVLSEMGVYKKALAAAAAPEELVMWERHLITKGTSHTHTQVVPVATGSAAKLRAAFAAAAAAEGIAFTPVPDGTALPDIDGVHEWPYIFVEYADGVREICVLRDGVRVGLTFCRGVVAAHLGMPERTSWKECVVGEQDETQLAEQFIARFAPHEPTFEDAE
ncbi:zinc finger CCCH domain-containing protein 59 [Thecamonas trahens ATCC 50062]|uniref:Zinc finger CCCH domain-containing protein 59 n=1 Tax=Thecamonas trahens ATCC 50062 TaxID=461836 RepID=A0A0L0DN55_THETB|nr:zinc finger CCCH domain-containing protein 59 [Thecamonas trahens ATCC 50062]KNC53690.1 zinc finger CCCH domain-containing protein 59 [Thecamonas trahens ATCC 50062]|eukprot:XP_013762004.1 zinc finger CCCH domain-containing protein 59 [Thecamonas trahens ATCC 50062]